MIEFVICDDNEVIRKNVEEIIDKLMINSNVDYITLVHNDYNKKFMESIKHNDRLRIYILDIETPTQSGIDIARFIRKHDKQSIIIFLTAHNELGNDVIRNRLNCLTFISKYDNYEENIKESIKDALNYLGKSRIIEFIDKGIKITLDTSKIIYVYRDTYERKCHVIMDKNKYKTYLTISELKHKLGDDFIQTHRACIVNRKRIKEISVSKTYIKFDNDMTTDLISDMYKKELKKYEKCN